MAGFSSLTIASLNDTPIWVAWQTENRADGKPTKVPYGPDGRRARADGPATWGKRPQVEAVAARLPKPYGKGGVGIEFPALGDGRSLGGVDLDSCRDPATGAIEPWAHEIAALFNSYTEVSPSGTGAKVFFTYETADLKTLRAAMGTKHGRAWKRGGGDHPPAIEVHLGNRYFAVTEELLNGFPVELRHVETETLLKLLQVTGPAFVAGGEAPRADDRSAKRGKAERMDRSRSALAFAKGRALRRGGATFEEMVEALHADPETAEWTGEKGEANGQRELRRIWDKSDAKGPVIRVVAGDLHLTTTAAEDALIAAGLPIYQRGDQGLVRPIVLEVPASRGRMTLAAGFGELTVYSLVDVMCSTAEWEKYDARAEDWVRINPPSQVAQVLLSRQGYWRFPSVRGVITTPTLRADGSLLTAPGYDPATRLFHVVDPALTLRGSVFTPGREAAEGALKALCDLLAEFPFVTAEGGGEAIGVAKSVALAALITPVVRGAMPVVPLIALRANAPGSGKSYLVDIASAIATGRPCPVISAGPDEAETEKRLCGLLLAGHPLVSLDNINGELGGDLLCQATERPLLRLRRLGGSDIIEIENWMTIFATGNNLRLRGDLTRRSVASDLDAKQERPELRTFKGDPVATVLADRGTYVSAALVIVRAYIAAGCPNPPSPLVSFGEWSRLVRGALIWLGCADPVTSMTQARDDDPELGELTEVIGAWHAAIGTDETTCGGAIKKAKAKLLDGLEFPELHDVLVRVAGRGGDIDSRALGKWLHARQGRVVGELRFKRSGETDGAARWKLERLAR
jgi:hypothetical protein